MFSRLLFGFVVLLLAAGAIDPAAAASKARPVGAKFRDCAECPEMIVIPPGSFTMGSAASEDLREDIEGPQHKVTIGRSFALGVTHITRAEYARFVRETGHYGGPACNVFDVKQQKGTTTASRNWRDPGFPQTDRDPVVCVDYDDAHAYVAWINEKVRRALRLPVDATPYRLPSEAEWEYATRAGTTTRSWWGDTISHEYANFGADCAGPACGPLVEGKDVWIYTAPVASLAPNPFGLYDMAGNAWQWIEDCYEASYEGAPTDGTARTSCGRPIFVSRGSAWVSHPRYLRSAARDRLNPDYRSGYLGIRLARTLD